MGDAYVHISGMCVYELRYHLSAALAPQVHALHSRIYAIAFAHVSQCAYICSSTRHKNQECNHENQMEEHMCLQHATHP